MSVRNQQVLNEVIESSIFENAMIVRLKVLYAYILNLF